GESVLFAPPGGGGGELGVLAGARPRGRAMGRTAAGRDPPVRRLKGIRRRTMKQALAGVAVLLSVVAALAAPQTATPRGVALADLAWPDAEPWLTASMVVVIPLGAGALEQGMHMKLNSDERLARHFAARVLAASAIAVTPPLTYQPSPAYAGYPGSTSLGAAAARDFTVDPVRSLARFGPRRFSVLNTSAATIGALQSAAKTLADAGILLGYTDPD